MKLTGIAATTNEMLGDSRHMRFTLEDLELMAAQAVGVPVYVDFDKTVPPVGRIIRAEIEGKVDKHKVTGCLRIVVELMTAQPRGEAPVWPAGEKGLYCVPGVTGTGEPPAFKVSELTEFGITHKPADTSTDLEPLTTLLEGRWQGYLPAESFLR
jgi:hypothetical protein